MKWMWIYVLCVSQTHWDWEKGLLSHPHNGTEYCNTYPAVSNTFFKTNVAYLSQNGKCIYKTLLWGNRTHCCRPNLITIAAEAAVHYMSMLTALIRLNHSRIRNMIKFTYFKYSYRKQLRCWIDWNEWIMYMSWNLLSRLHVCAQSIQC